MKRLGQILAAVAALVAGGLGINEAFRQVAQENQINCKDARSMAREIEDVQKKRRFYLLFTAPVGDLPAAYDGRLLGNCSGGTCGFSACGLDAEYTYEVKANVSGNRLIEIFAHPYFARAWRSYAQDTVEIEFFGAMAEVRAACLSRYSEAQCRNILGQGIDCWMRSDDTLCRHEYDPAGLECLNNSWPCIWNQDDPPACVPDNGARPIPCVCYGSSACVDAESTEALDDLAVVE